ncbi:hypothetical protein, partial [Acinetobacter baumannii]|uniref:hypothetical protein n=1 Tax=Acinetobacter baumannii TaxID=470 RepID=UPI003D6C4208
GELPDADRLPPVVTDLRLVTNPQGITGIVLAFSTPLDATRAQDLRSYSYSVQGAGFDRIFGTRDDVFFGMLSATYD